MAATHRDLLSFVVVVFTTLLVLSCHSAPTIKVGTAMAAYSKFAYEIEDTLAAYRMWAEYVNSTGGITVNGTTYFVELIIYENKVGSDVTAELKKLLEVDKVDFLLAPYSSSVALNAKAPVIAAKKLMISGGASSEQVFTVGSKYLFTVFSPSSAWMRGCLMSTGLQGAQSIVTVLETGDQAAQGWCDGAQQTAKDLFMTVLDKSNITSSATSNTTIHSLISKYVGLKPDIFVGCVNDPLNAEYIVNISKKLDFAPKAFCLTKASSQSTFIQNLQNDAMYVLGPNQWYYTVMYNNPALPPFYGDAQYWGSTFEKKYGRKPGYQAAGAAAAGLVLHLSILSAGSLDTDKVIDAVASFSQTTFYGDIEFSRAGLNRGNDPTTLQVQPQDVTWQGARIVAVTNRTAISKVVSPERAAVAKAIYPAPTWSERIYVPSFYSDVGEQVILAFTGLCILLALILMALIVIKRKENSIKHSSPAFCLGSIFGALLIYSSVFVWLKSANAATCFLRPWLLGVGFTLLFGFLFARTWRIHKVMNQKNKFARVIVTNMQMLKFVIAFLVPELVILVVWSAVSPLKVTEESSDPLRASTTTRYCGNSSVGIIVFYVMWGFHKLVMSVWGAYLAFTTRKVQMINKESKTIGFAMYNIILFATIGVILEALLPVDTSYIFACVLILLAVSITLYSLFYTRVFLVLKIRDEKTELEKRRQGLSDKLIIVERHLADVSNEN